MSPTLRLPGLRAQWIRLPFWSSTMVAPHSIVVRSPAKRPNRAAFEQHVLAPDVLHDGLLGQRQAVAGALVGAHDLGDDDVGVERE